MKKIELTQLERINGGEPNWSEFFDGFCAGFGLATVAIWASNGFSASIARYGSGGCGIGAGLKYLSQA